VLIASGFPPQLRLKNAGEFDFVFEQPFRSSSRYFTVLARLSQRDYPRLGLVISKRCARAAVERNRLKRLIRESFRGDKDRLTGLDIVVIGKTAAITADNRALFVALNRHWTDLVRCKSS
jgi:ribonuclease P protein component